MKFLINALAAGTGSPATSLRPLLSAFVLAGKGRHQFEVVARAEIAGPADPKVPEVVMVGLRHRSLAERLYHEQLWLPLRAKGHDAMLTISSPAVFASPIPQAVMFQNALPYTPSALELYGAIRKARFATLKAVSIAGARVAQKAVFVSRAQRDLILPQLGLPLERSACVHMGRSLEFNPAARARAPEVLDRIGIRSPYLLTVGYIHRYKNLVQLVEGFALAKAKLPAEVSLVLVGADTDAEYAGAVRRAVQRAGLTDHVKLIGAVRHSDLPAVYAAASIFLFTSTCESFPGILIEALSSGVPTLTSRFGPMPELARDGAGYIDVFSPADIARRITELWEDPSAQKSLAARGVAQAETFSWDATASGLLDVLEGIA